jgi:hypothetical protein
VADEEDGWVGVHDGQVRVKLPVSATAET